VAHLDPIVAFLAGLLAGGFAIFVAAIVVVDVWNYARAVVTAFLGGLLWALAAELSHPVATVLVLFLWIVVINVAYPGGWSEAAVVGFFAWATALLVFFLADVLFGIEVAVFGIPGM
jgi:hypothetical protein